MIWISFAPSVICPPQDGGSIGDSNLGANLSKMLPWEWFCDNICKLVSKAYMKDLKWAISYAFANKVIVKSYMLHPRVIYGISTKICGPVLSQYNFGVIELDTQSSCSKFWTHAISVAALARALYSASVEECETDFCLLERQDIILETMYHM